MYFILPLAYSFFLFFSLTTVCIYVLNQIKIIQEIEKRLLILKSKIQTDEQFFEDFYKLGKIYFKKKNYEKALILFQKALKTCDSDNDMELAVIYNMLGFVCFQLKRYQYAEYYYLKAIGLAPDYILALTNLALIYKTKKMYRNAYNSYKVIADFQMNNKLALSQIETLKNKIIRDGRI
jgi:tetratricopeptide (TPR) repeat protein